MGILHPPWGLNAFCAVGLLMVWQAGDCRYGGAWAVSPLSKHILFEKTADLLPFKGVGESEVFTVYFPASHLCFPPSL